MLFIVSGLVGAYIAALLARFGNPVLTITVLSGLYFINPVLCFGCIVGATIFQVFSDLSGILFIADERRNRRNKKVTYDGAYLDSKQIDFNHFILITVLGLGGSIFRLIPFGQQAIIFINIILILGIFWRYLKQVKLGQGSVILTVAAAIVISITTQISGLSNIIALVITLTGMFGTRCLVMTAQMGTVNEDDDASRSGLIPILLGSAAGLNPFLLLAVMPSRNPMMIVLASAIGELCALARWFINGSGSKSVTTELLTNLGFSALDITTLGMLVVIIFFVYFVFFKFVGNAAGVASMKAANSSNNPSYLFGTVVVASIIGFQTSIILGLAFGLATLFLAAFIRKNGVVLIPAELQMCIPPLVILFS